MVGKAIFSWFLSIRSQNVPLSAAIIQKKVLTFTKVLNVDNFQVSDDWLRYWSERNQTTFKTTWRESESVTPELVDGWWETSLPILLENYELKDIYNADEFGFLYEHLPNKIYQPKSEKCSGRKLSKICIAGLEVANAAGHKLPMFVTGKAKKRWCLKNKKFLPCRYRNQQKIWMDGVLFEEWVKARRFILEGDTTESL